MKIAIHQPHYFPYPGFFQKISSSDAYVIMDNTQYDKRFTNRNKIIVKNGWTWLTVPIIKKYKFAVNKDVQINNDISWKEDHWKKIFHSYQNSKFFNLYSDYFYNLYKHDWDNLFDLDLETTKKVLDWLDIDVDIIFESELNVSGKSVERLVNICNAIGADTYVSGSGASEYLDEKLFESNGIHVQYTKYDDPHYSQHLSSEFIPGLSIIDMLCNLGPESKNLINPQLINFQ